MNSKLPRRIRVMDKVRDTYDGACFTTTSTHVSITFMWRSDMSVFMLHHGGIQTGDFTVTLTHAQFDKLYAV